MAWSIGVGKRIGSRFRRRWLMVKAIDKLATIAVALAADAAYAQYAIDE